MDAFTTRVDIEIAWEIEGNYSPSAMALAALEEASIDPTTVDVGNLVDLVVSMSADGQGVEEIARTCLSWMQDATSTDV